MEQQPENTWALTDEEWCEMCFMLVELGAAQQQLQELMLSDERPSLNQLWLLGSAYQRRSQALFGYMGQQLRERALEGERRPARPERLAA